MSERLIRISGIQFDEYFYRTYPERELAVQEPFAATVSFEMAGKDREPDTIAGTVYLNEEEIKQLEQILDAVKARVLRVAETGALAGPMPYIGDEGIVNIEHVHYFNGVAQ